MDRRIPGPSDGDGEHTQPLTVARRISARAAAARRRELTFESLEANNHAIGAQRELQSPALGFQPHGDSLVILKPERAFSLVP